ncbi:Na+/proline symporter [Fluviicoccus keumensis]|uniref:histidine kinase n=1 Tax=Fluviicoccus keumensis TaxID=1435465 RepID=A0A4Q7Z642_9GAMM|nr:PAS-domain containing protein [Fluviicoccus keumensis]RZU45341.1 Na+/proline symporter [Fluviicoccus keumensis]
MTPWIVALLALLYVAGLFGIARLAERPSAEAFLQRHGGLIYSLTLAVYCTSWTYYGAVGTAVSSGWQYVPIYLGPLLVLLFGQALLTRIARITRQQNAASLADFISTRYGKRQGVAVGVTLVCLIVVVPYIALQLKAVAQSYRVLLGEQADPDIWWQNSALMSALAMTVFAMLFATRPQHLTGRNRGIMAAIAFESLVKLVALVTLAVGAAFLLARPQQWLADFTAHAARTPFDALSFFTKTVLAMGAVFLLPRQFHVAFVENTDPRHLRQARGWFGGYLLLVTLVVMPIALAGMQLYPHLTGQADRFVLLLPSGQGWGVVSALVFIGGFSAATSMIIIATLALSAMISSSVVMPALLDRFREQGANRDFGPVILRVRRLMIATVMALSYAWYAGFARDHELAETGLLAFSLIIQLLPAVVGGLYWRRGHAYGVYAGLLIGTVLWFLLLMMPSLMSAVANAAGLPRADDDGPLDALSRGVFWSLGLNTLAYVGVSLLSRPDLRDRLQASAFIRPQRGDADEAASSPRPARRARMSTDDLMILLERFVGNARARETLHPFQPGDAATPSLALIRQVERELAGVIGAAGAAAMVEAALDGRQLDFEDVVTLFDDTREVIQFSRHILFATLEHLGQGVSVVDKDLQLVAWNQAYLDLFNYPASMVKVGRPIADIVRFNAERGLCGPGSPDEHVEKRLQHLRRGTPHVFRRVRPDGTVIEMQGNPIPGGGFVTRFTDITEQVRQMEALAEAKEDLELRVQQRTREISDINAELRAEVDLRRVTEQQLRQAKGEAEAANAAKNRFLALASHDILQPLNAARLFAAALEQGDPARRPAILGQLDNSLKATEELISTLLEIARLDEGKVEPDNRPVALQPLLQQLDDEFSLLAERQGLKLKVRAAPWTVNSNPTYLRRILQNLISNAIKYTAQGKVLVGCRRRGRSVVLEVWDTGPGIPPADLERIFEDFYRVDATARGRQGIGLGLGVVQRMANSLGHALSVASTPGKGSVFRLSVPLADAAASTASVVPTTAGQSLLSGLSVFCVDDDRQNLEALKALFEQWGVGQVECLPDAEAAVERAITLAAAPDLLLLDYQLGGGLDGLSLAKALRARWPQVAVLLVSAAPDPDLPQRAKAEGVLFLAKPVRAGALKAVLNSVRVSKG